MKPISIRQNLHTVIDVLPAAKINEIYHLLVNNYKDEFKVALTRRLCYDGISAGETDLIVQQLLS